VSRKGKTGRWEKKHIQIQRRAMKQEVGIKEREENKRHWAIILKENE
jgi:hypothetical protein